MSNRGFTLIEILIALLLGAFLLTALWTSFLLASCSVSSTRHCTQAMDLCEAQLEALQAKTVGELEALKGQTLTEQLSLDYSDDKSSAIPCTRVTTITDSDSDNVYEIVVQVQWIERYLGGDRTSDVILHTKIAKVNV